jgi:hypothetical protein
VPPAAQPGADAAAGTAPSAASAASRSLDLPHIALGGAITSVNDPTLTLTVADLQSHGGRTRIHLVLQNRSSRPASVVFDYERSFLVENSGRVLKILADSSGAPLAGSAVIQVRPEGLSRCWVEVPSIAADTATLSFSLAAPVAAPKAPAFGPFAVRLAGSAKPSRETGR